MSHAGTAIAGNLGLCRLRCLWRCIKPHPVAMFFLRPIQQFLKTADGEFLPFLRWGPENLNLDILVPPSDARCYGMLYWLGWASAAGYATVPCLRCNADRMAVADSKSRRCQWDASCSKSFMKIIRDPETASVFSVVLESRTVSEPIKNKNQYHPYPVAVS